MPWATRRRVYVFLIIAVILALPLTGILLAVFHHVPTCTDGIRNQDESGIDCGGSCAYLCTVAQTPPTVLYTKTLKGMGGRTDVVASIKNNNTHAAARNVLYTVSLYSSDNKLAGEVQGTIDLPPGAVVPLYVPGIFSGTQNVTRAFLTFKPELIQWFSAVDARPKPLVSNRELMGTIEMPRVRATLANPTATAMTDITVFANIYDDQGNIIGASRTIVPYLKPQGTADAIFTWNAPFPGTATNIEILAMVGY